MNKIKEKTIKGIFWVGGSRALSQLFTWFITIYVARKLAPSDYGLMGMAMIFISFTQIVNEFGIGPALIQKKDISKLQISSLFWFSILLSMVLYTIVFFSAPYCAEFFEEIRLINVLRILALNFILSSFILVPYNLLAKELKFDKRSKAELISTFFSSFTVLLLAYNGFGVWSLVFSSICRNLVLCFTIFSFSRYIPSITLNFSIIIDLVKYGANFSGGKILWYFYSNSDYFIIGKLLGPKILGSYSLAFQLSSLPIGKIASIVNPVAFSAFSKIQDDNTQMQNYFLKILNYVAILTFPSLIGLSFVANEFVRFVLTDKWIEMILPLQVLCLIGIIRSLSFLFQPLLNSKGKTNITFKYNLLCGLILPSFFYLGALFYGIKGVLFGWCTIFPLLNLYILNAGLKEINLSYYDFIKNLIPVVASSFIMVLGLLFTRLLSKGIHHDLIRLTIFIVVGMALYVIPLLKMYPNIRNDMITTFGTLRNKKTALKEA